MTDYAVMVKHPGFIDRFLKCESPPENIGGSYWWASCDYEILRFKREARAKQIKADYELHFAAKKEKAYSFVVMETVMEPTWKPAEDEEAAGRADER